MGRSILRKKGSLGGAILDGKKGLESADMHVVSGLNGVTHISTVQEMPDSKMAAVDLPAHVGSLVLVPAAGSLEQDGDRPNKKVHLGKRELKALGGGDMDLTSGRPVRRQKTHSEPGAVQKQRSCSALSQEPVEQMAPASQPSQQLGIGPGRSKRAAALHAAEAIAAQAQGSGDLDGPDNADTAEWLEDDEQDLPATETGRASFDPVNSPVIKGPRTARKKNSEHLAGGFANSTLLRQRSSVPLEDNTGAAGEGEEQEEDDSLLRQPTAAEAAAQAAAAAEPAGQDEALKAALVDQAATVRDIMGVAVDKGITLREVLKGGALAGQPVYFQSRHGHLHLTGTITEEGHIACHCKQCRANGKVRTAGVSCSEFEEHAGSRERRPGESIYLTRLSISLKEFCALVNEEERSADRHGSACMVCMDGGDLLCCDGCPNAVHPFCVGLEEIPEGEWFCEACVARGCRPHQKAAPSPQKPFKAPKWRPPKQPGSKSAYKEKRHGGGGGGGGNGGGGGASAGAGGSAAKRGTPTTGRLHMAAPALRVVSGARRERNSNKHKRLFLPNEPGGLTDGEPVSYITSQGEELLKGTVRIDPSETGPSGILCACCNAVISCSQFEAHAGRGSRRAPYDNIFTAASVSLRKLASLMPASEVDSPTAYRAATLSAVGDRRGPVEPELVTVAGDGALHGGCVLCSSPDFLRGGFGERTMIICDQCEREFHIGCLAQHDRAHLTELPQGDWYCSAECGGIAARMRERAGGVAVPLEGEYSWQILRGKDGTHATTWALKAAQEILTESFDPILDLVTGADLMMAMVYAQELGDWDYTGMYTAVLRRRGKAVCAAVFRVFGPRMAEVPLVATRLGARRQGHARILMTAFENYFRELGVATICLPAAQSTVDTWTHGFGFAQMSPEQLAATRSELRVLIFPGTELLHKQLNPDAVPATWPQPTSAAPDAAAAPAEMPADGADDVADQPAEADAPTSDNVPCAAAAAAAAPLSAEEPEKTKVEPDRPEAASAEQPEAEEGPSSSAPKEEEPSGEQQAEPQEGSAQQPKGRGRGRGRGRQAAPPHRKTVALRRRSSSHLEPSGPGSAPVRQPSGRLTRASAALALSVPEAPEAAAAPADPVKAELDAAADAAADGSASEAAGPSGAAEPVADGAAAAASAGASAPSREEAAPVAVKDNRGVDTETEASGRQPKVKAEAAGAGSEAVADKKQNRKSLGLLREVLSLSMSTAAGEDAPLFPVTWGGSAESTRSRSQATTGRPSFPAAPSEATGRGSTAAQEDTATAGRSDAIKAEHPRKDKAVNGVINGTLRRTRHTDSMQKGSDPMDTAATSAGAWGKRKAAEQHNGVASRTRQKR